MRRGAGQYDRATMTRSRIERLCGLVILSSVLGACTGAGRIPTTATPDEATLTTARGSTSSSPRVTANPATSTPTGGRSGSEDAAPFCAVALPASWEAAKTTETENVVAMSTTGSVRWATPELSWVAPGSRTHIANVPAPGLGSAWLVGHHVAYQRLRSDENWGDWELYLWDSTRQGRPVKLDESDGQVPNAPFLLVATSGDALVWLHPLKDGRREVRLHQVAAGRTTVVHVGHVGTPLVAGDLLMWPEAFAIDTSPRLVAVDLRTLEPAPLPGPLAELRDPQEMSSDGGTFAWASADRRRLLVWQRGWPAARVVTETEEGNPVTWPKVSGDTVSWVADRTYTADLRSGSFAPMTKQWGAAEAWGDRFLHIGVPAGSGDGFHLDTSTLPPLPGCR